MQVHTNDLSERVMRLTNRISHPTLTQKIDISDSRAVIQYVERPYTTCSFKLGVNTHKMLYQKVIVMHIWIHNLLVVSRIQL